MPNKNKNTRWAVVKGNTIMDFTITTSRNKAIGKFLKIVDSDKRIPWKVWKENGYKTAKITLTW